MVSAAIRGSKGGGGAETHGKSPEVKSAGKLRRDPQLQLELEKHWQMDSDSDEVEPRPLAAVLLLGLAVAICISVALTQPYLEFEFRVAGVVIHRVTPSALQLFESIGSVNRFLMAFAGLTLLVLPFFWFLALCRRLASQRQGVEPLLRPTVMCHVWAASLVGAPK